MEPNKVFRQGKQCRERWINHLDPSMNRGAWTQEEDIQLLEVHLQVGKKWAEIAKILRTRTENAVKNRWNSLIKKYKNEYGMDFDTLSTSSAYSNQSMEDLERKIAELIVSNKKKRPQSEESSPDGVIQKIVELPEEESPGYYSDFTVEPTPQRPEVFGSFQRKDEEMERNDLKGSQKKPNKKKPITSVSLAKNNLRDMVTEEIQTSTLPFPQKSNSSENLPEDINRQGDNTVQQVFMFGNNNNNNNHRMNNGNMLTDQNLGSNVNSMSHFNQQSKEPRNNLYNITNDILGLNTNDILGLNMWRNNLNNYNVFGQAPQQDLLGLYNQGNIPQNNYNIAPAGLGMGDGYKDQYKCTSSQPMNSIPENDRSLKRSETQEMEPRTITLTERPLNQLGMNENLQGNLYYAVVDLSGGNMYLMDPINKDNFPPTSNIIKSKNTMQNPTSLNNLNGGSMEIIGNSPALHGSWTSPPLNTATMMNYPLFNNPLMGFGKNFSPNINLFQESPKFDRNLFGNTPKMEGSDWTPETLNRPLFSGLGIRQRLGLANSRGETPPDIKIGTANGAFLRRIDEKGKPTTATVSEGGMKYSSPSSFLMSSQTNHLNRNKV